MTRDRGIDFLMCLAVLLVVNSHCDALYPDAWRFLAAAVFSLPLTPTTLFDGWKPAGYWFLKCIMIHYAAFYLVFVVFGNRLKAAFGLVVSGIAVWWAVAYTPDFARTMLHAPAFEWYYLFAFTLLGGILARRGTRPRAGFLPAAAGLVGAVGLHYGWLRLVDRVPALLPVRVLCVVTLAGVVLSLFVLVRTETLESLARNRFWGGVIALIGGLCLEVYISHSQFVTTAYNRFFPLNLAGYLAVALAAAYAIRCITRTVVQTFDRNGPYDWKAVVGI